MTLLIVFNAVAAFLATGRAALTSRRATPLDAVLGRIPWPARRKDSPCTTAATAASTARTSRRTSTKSRVPKAATTPDFAVPHGRHHASAPLTVRFDVGGERADGTYIHGGTGPMPRLDGETFFADAIKLAGHAGRGL